MPEYLRFEPDESLFPEAYFSFQDLIKESKILAPAFLGLMLTQARAYLINTPGEHQPQREILVPKWLDYWIRLMSKETDSPSIGSQRVIAHPNIVSLEEMANRFINSPGRTGIWNMATGEGSPAHRWAWHKSQQRASQVGLLFEGSRYFDQHLGRRFPCLSESIRASMACLFGLLVSVSPDKPDDISENDHYQMIYHLSGADINFTTTENNNYQLILLRNPERYRSSALIEPLDMHMSSMIEKLVPDIELFNLTSKHTSDMTIQLFRKEREKKERFVKVYFSSLEEMTEK